MFSRGQPSTVLLQSVKKRYTVGRFPFLLPVHAMHFIQLFFVNIRLAKASIPPERPEEDRS